MKDILAPRKLTLELVHKHLKLFSLLGVPTRFLTSFDESEKPSEYKVKRISPPPAPGKSTLELVHKDLKQKTIFMECVAYWVGCQGFLLLQ